MSTYRLTFITPLFSKGVYEDRPEVRAASIRGQLHWWFRALGGSYRDEKDVFGGVHKGITRDNPKASRVVVRVADVQGQKGQPRTLPHKGGGAAAPKWAFMPGTSCVMQIQKRLGGLSQDLDWQFGLALSAWLHMGSLGLRATRGGGCFRWEPLDQDSIPYPSDFDKYQSQCNDLIRGSKLQVTILKELYTDPEQARKDITDTLGGRDDSQSQSDLGQLRNPLGCIGSSGMRKTSPLRLRVVACQGKHRILALWDGRYDITGNQAGDLAGAIKLLVKANKPIGRQLASSSFANL